MLVAVGFGRLELGGTCLSSWKQSLALSLLYWVPYRGQRPVAFADPWCDEAHCGIQSEVRARKRVLTIVVATKPIWE